MEQKEIWKFIDGYKNHYMVSNLGNIISLKYNKKTEMKKCSCRKGYHRVGLHDENGEKKKSVHRLVAISFVPNPENKEQVNHKNGIKTDNRAENLEWTSNRENCSHSFMRNKKTSKYLGVHFNKKHNNWKSQIRIGNKRKHLGSFNSEIEAYNAYKEAMNEFNIKNIYCQSND